MPDWLELELAETLRPVRAPDELWERISRAEPRKTRRSVVAAWPVAALLTMGIAAATLWFVAHGQEPPAGLNQLAAQVLRDESPLELRSDNPQEIGRWMQNQTGLTLSVPETTTARVLGARVIQHGKSPVAAVSYQVGQDSAVLLVARAGATSDSGHGQLSWTSRGQTYAIASTNHERPTEACVLCHSL